jgi:hypothetical protein
LRGRGAALIAVLAIGLVLLHPRGASASEIDLVGHDPLLSRGMNAGIAISGNRAYVGNRTDGSENHKNPGVLIVAIDDPTRPRVVGEIKSEANELGLSTRELRIWPQAGLLIVMKITCEAALHRCDRAATAPKIEFFDIRSSPDSPALRSTYRPHLEPHEMFLWIDPESDRALLFLSTNVASRRLPDLLVIDISRAREGVFREVASWNAEGVGPTTNGYPVRLHSISVSPDGRRGYASLWGGGFHVLDTSDLAEAKWNPKMRRLTRGGGLRWSGPAHSAVKVADRSLVVLSDETQEGCPWGWVRIADVSDEEHPALRGEFQVEQNRPSGCEELRAQGVASRSHTSHNATSVSDLALVTWHSAGLQALDLSNPARPGRAGSFIPNPLETVTTEDPALTAGGKGVAFWSYPIIKDGFIYVVDVRNGLYVLRYKGTRADAVAAVRFSEGNSNVGETLQPSPATVATPAAPPAGAESRERQVSWWPEAPIVVGVLLLALAVVGWLRTRRI